MAQQPSFFIFCVILRLIIKIITMENKYTETVELFFNRLRRIYSLEKYIANGGDTDHMKELANKEYKGAIEHLNNMNSSDKKEQLLLIEALSNAI